MVPIGVIGCALKTATATWPPHARGPHRSAMVASTLTVDRWKTSPPNSRHPGFFQLYTPTTANWRQLVSRAEAAGFKGIVVTLDTWSPAAPA